MISMASVHRASCRPVFSVHVWMIGLICNIHKVGHSICPGKYRLDDTQWSDLRPLSLVCRIQMTPHTMARNTNIEINSSQRPSYIGLYHSNSMLLSTEISKVFVKFVNEIGYYIYI